MTGYGFDDGEGYEQFMGRWSLGIGKAFMAWLQPPKGARWLDIGCGTGTFTELISETCDPAAVTAIDPSHSQISCARKRVPRVEFRLADAQRLPLPDSTFDVVVSALVMNFIPDKPRAASEMLRVARPGGLIAACVWDLEAELSPSGPLRRALRNLGIEAPPVPGTDESGTGGLLDLFDKVGLAAVDAISIEVAVSYRDFDDFWRSQTPHYVPTTRIIAAMSPTDRLTLMEEVRANLRPLGGGVGYSAWANAVKGHCPA